MIKNINIPTLLFTMLLFYSKTLWAGAGFEVTVLGDRGGIKDGNLTAFLVRAQQDVNYLALDAGTLVNGIEVAERKGAFAHVTIPKESEYGVVGYILRDRIKGYLLSHAHLDHVSGLVIASPEDSKKNIYGLANVNKALSETYFNWVAWPNFADQGKGFKIGQYHYVDLPIGQSQAITNTSLKVTAFPVNHTVETGAFVIENQGDIMVFFGDTGPDSLSNSVDASTDSSKENSRNLTKIWQYLAPKVQANKLKGLIIEVSFPNETPDKSLFGHMTPKWLFKELSKLEQQSGGKGSLNGLKVVIQHIKYSLKKGADIREIIKSQLNELNNLGVEIIISNQGEQIQL
ncbi:3',5'-cyclic-nucleotide phosphodiesterase [Psychrosphaera saromensis]|uniref:3',5'-cyclic-nucleotide phosphodiesterase n=1 Tax=Psychrosphaera saromensis TaxID=716813 RepID=A0A2S7UWR8_9GAMM|nr:3',5'-cyclic-nucleotide phosphodiesterase [Psychrosphaera saromensis]PQJ54426.1 3',5'-cyclic-nucleotide phosphodiesterase [Psychrosphaera saromensis]GHB60045.1 3',5'-cyclic-nucleotide phosphodiesterase [Psychrosphaera saromensis]GLQ14379.1 3',5'-cyclic-nucleotide phosphodiesterase [Psychrosphaera saromensis]